MMIMRFTLLKKNAFGDNSKVRFSVVSPFLNRYRKGYPCGIRKVFYTFLHHKILAISIVIFLSLGQLYLYGQEKQDAMVEAQEHYRQGKELYSQGRYEEADIEFEKAVELMKAASASAQTKPEAVQAPQAQPEEARVQQPEQVSPKTEAQPPEPEKLITVTTSLSASSNVTLDFKEADIQNVLKIISYKSGVNIVSTPDVVGNVTMRLVDVPWETALDVLLKTYGFGYQRQGNIILVTKMENISKIQAEEPLYTEIVTLKFLDAVDAEKILIPLLSPRGKISVLYTRGQKGWTFGTFKIGREGGTAKAPEREKEVVKSETISIERSPTGDLVSRKAEFEPSIKSKTLIITDTAGSLDKIRNVILPQIDKKPRQVSIEARIMEVNRDKLKDIGIDWGIGSTGATTTSVATTPVDKSKAGGVISAVGGRLLGSEVTPSIFGPKEGTTLIPGIEPYNVGLELMYQKLTGTQFQTILHALEEDVHTNTLSAPRILTLDNQEAAILVGYHTPILKSTVTAGTTAGEGATVTQDLDYYQEIGIRLNVVPQISEEGYINMIIHPSVTSSTSGVTATSTAGGATTTTTFPIIDVRETQTQILTKNGETIVIGGLLKDVVGKQTIGIPFLSKLPLLGPLFRRDTYDTQKVDLLIFITARIVKEDEFTPEEIARLEKELGKEDKPIIKKK